MSEKNMASAVTASFDRAARSYEGHAHVQKAMAEWLAEWLPSRREGSAIEIGAGPGIFTRHLLPWKGPLSATDISPAMCAAGSAALPEARWRIQSAVTPEEGPWDWIFSSSMLQWAAEPERIFAAWRACLANNGRILGGLFVEETLPELQELIGAADPVIWRTAEQWRAHLCRAGLQVVRDAEEGRVFHYPSALAFLRSLHGTGTAPQRRSSTGQLRRWLKEYESRFHSPNGVKATWTFYRFEASR